MTSNEETRVVPYGDGEIVLVARPKNKHRELRRQVYRKLANALPGTSVGTVDEFAAVITYVSGTTGDIWKPPSPHASEQELVDAFHFWMNDVDEDFTNVVLGELEKK